MSTPRTTPLPFPLRLDACRAALALSFAATLSACGGGGTIAAQRDHPRAAAPAAATEPLFDARGDVRLSPMALVPTDTAARSRSGLYATPAQLAWEELIAPTTTVLLDVDALGSTLAAVQLAEQVRGWRDTRGLAFFVRARRPVDAATVANALTDAGFAPVFVVV